MGYDNEHAQPLIFDIETAPLDGAEEFLEPVEAPANYKDPLKISAYIEEKRQEQLDKCGLDVDLGRVVAIGMQLEGQDVSVISGKDVSEANMLRAFWTQAAIGHHLIGFNCLGFDLPVLFRRSLYLRVETCHVQIDRFKHPCVTDLLDELSYSGRLRMRGLSFYCRRFGIPDTDTLKGADIAKAVAEGHWDLVEAHVRCDVLKTTALAARMGHLKALAVA